MAKVVRQRQIAGCEKVFTIQMINLSLFCKELLKLLGKGTRNVDRAREQVAQFH